MGGVGLSLLGDVGVIKPLFFAILGVVLDRAYGWLKDQKRQYTEEVCRPMLEEVRSVAEGYDSVKNLDSEPYPYRNDEFHSVWNTNVRELRITDSQKKTIPRELREKLERYGEKVTTLQELEAEKRDDAGEIPSPGSRYYKVLCYSAPILLTCDQKHQFSLEVQSYAERCGYHRAKEVIEEWESSDEFPDPYWSELGVTTGQWDPMTEVNIRRRTGIFWKTFEEQYEEYEALEECASNLAETLSKEENRGLLSYTFERYLSR